MGTEALIEVETWSRDGLFEAERTLTKIRTLFYPCAGRDVDLPVRAFGALVDEFWFVDIRAYLRRMPNIRGVLPTDVQTKDYVLGESGLVVRNCRYRHPHFYRTVDLNFVTGDGAVAFAELFSRADSVRELSVFFHRGDSPGEGGSNVYWLHDEDPDGDSDGHLRTVLTTLAGPGLICTDGSNAMVGFCAYFRDPDAPPDSHKTVPPVRCHSHTLLPIGTLDVRNGPTVVYQSTRP